MTSNQYPYKTYILFDQTTQSRLAVVPERGAIVTSWQFNGQEIFYLDQERFTNPALSVRGGMPILFPICGNLPNDTYTYQGKEFKLKQHGFARDLPWEVADQKPTQLTVVLNSNAQTQAVYPFKFQVIFTYQLAGNTLKIHQRYTNYSPTSMPFSIGLHPYFLAQDKTQLHFDIPAHQAWDQLTQQTSSFTGSFDWNRDEVDTALRPLSAPAAIITDRSRNLTISLAYESVYSTLVFWTLKGKEFYCLEPWSAPRNAINTGEDLTHLAPETCLETSVTLKVNCI
ncbi:MAG TPA: hypothetical protein V6D03_01025 [Candidatus Caenarcaniphilales bacterium]